ncbi:hypothetical protein N9M39_00305 [Halieaceae bacterium]|nr:hypothetical protein [Halieaceae bacterium]
MSSKEVLRRELEQQVAAYLRSGGEVQQLPPDATGERILEVVYRDGRLVYANGAGM